jgi:hypothetical protein
MTHAQADTIDHIVEQYGRAAIHDGFADKHVRVTVPGGKCWNVMPHTGSPIPTQPNHSVDWSYE